MGCRLTDFIITDDWTVETIGGKKVEMVAASTKPCRYSRGLKGTLFKVNGRFQGFCCGTLDTIREMVARDGEFA